MSHFEPQGVDPPPPPPAADQPPAPLPLALTATGRADDFKDGARKREMRVALVLGPLVLLGVAFAAGYATAYDDGEELQAAERRIQRQNDQLDRLGDSLEGLPRGEVTSDLWCWEAPLEGCAPCPSPFPGSSGRT
jgi:hypothetical protein